MFGISRMAFGERIPLLVDLGSFVQEEEPTFANDNIAVC